LLIKWGEKKEKKGEGIAAPSGIDGFRRNSQVKRRGKKKKEEIQKGRCARLGGEKKRREKGRTTHKSQKSKNPRAQPVPEGKGEGNPNCPFSALIGGRFAVQCQRGRGKKNGERVCGPRPICSLKDVIEDLEERGGEKKEKKRKRVEVPSSFDH